MNPECRLQVGNTKIKQVEKFEYLGSIITEDEKCDTGIRRGIEMTKMHSKG